MTTTTAPQTSALAELADRADRAARVAARRADTIPTDGTVSPWEQLAAAHRVVAMLATALAAQTGVDGDQVAVDVWEELEAPAYWGGTDDDWGTVAPIAPSGPIQTTGEDEISTVILWGGHDLDDDDARAAVRSHLEWPDWTAELGASLGKVRRVFGRWALISELPDGRITYPCPYHLWWDERPDAADGYAPATVIEVLW